MENFSGSLVAGCYIGSAAQHGSGVGDRHHGDDDGHNDGGNIGVLCLLVDCSGNERGDEQEEDRAVAPDTADHFALVGVPHGKPLGEVGQVLDKGVGDSTAGIEQAEYCGVELPAHIVVIEAVAGNRVNNIEEQEEGQESEPDKDLVLVEGLECENPKSEVGLEEVVRSEEDEESQRYRQKSENDCLPDFFLVHLQADSLGVKAVLFANREVPYCEHDNAEHAGDCRPCADREGAGLIKEVGGL